MWNLLVCTPRAVGRPCRLFGIATDFRSPGDAARFLAEAVHPHADGADAVWFAAVEHLAGHARHEVLHANVAGVVLADDGFEDEVFAVRGEG